MDLKEIKKIATKKHKGQKRKQGTPAILHPLGVAEILKEKGFSQEYQIAGLLHDTIEDNEETTYEEILKITNLEIATAVNLVTKEENYDEQDYHDRIMKNDMARMVKLADRLYNLRDAVNANIEFQKKYIKETMKWYVNMAKGTCFEKEINEAIENLKKTVKRKEYKQKIERYKSTFKQKKHLDVQTDAEQKNNKEVEEIEY